MCGICGIVCDDKNIMIHERTLRDMNDAIRYRGPDDEGCYFSSGIGLAMRRLSIIDVEHGKQPVKNRDGSIVTVCNGEIYNFQELKDDLQKSGHVFKCKSDVEVIPHLYETFGLDFVKKLNGMFGLALWDSKHRRLIIARDRMGQKPLYWTHQRGVFVFASELKALIKHPECNREIDSLSLSKYLAYEYVPAPSTIFKSIYKLEPGTMLILEDGKISIQPYWNVPIDHEYQNISEKEAVTRFLSLFNKSVKRRLISDVPLGVFLSGGIDSSAIVATMADMMPRKDIKTFSISFKEKSFDESSYARKVADYLGTDHHERVFTPENLIDLLPEIARNLDEPFADASIVPTYALSKFTREYVTVALGGDGGDELLAGYPTFQADVYANRYMKLPAWLRNTVIEPLAKKLPVSNKNISYDFKIKQFIRGAKDLSSSRHITWIGSFSKSELRELLQFDVSERVYEDVYRHMSDANTASYGNKILYTYKKLYLAEDILTKVDRASMWTSLEARAPFLDHELVEFVAALPYNLKLHNLTLKYLLKRAVGDKLPSGIANRSKKGFGIPVAKWLKGPLKESAGDLLSADRITRQGFFKADVVTKLFDDHIKGKADNRKKLWTLMVFENWIDNWI